MYGELQIPNNKYVVSDKEIEQIFKRLKKIEESLHINRMHYPPPNFTFAS